MWLAFVLGCVDVSLTPIDDCTDPVTTWRDADGDGFGAGEPEASCDPPGGVSLTPGDCDDADPWVRPGQVELCDGVDQDCDGEIDEDAADGVLVHPDADADGFGDPKVTQRVCEVPAGWLEDDGDCDDAEASVRPGADERCNLRDDDCDGAIDEDPVDPVTWWPDLDHDDKGAGEPVAACEQPDGYANNADDCDDTDPSVWEECGGGPVVVTGTCTYPVTSWTDPEPTRPELNLVAMYESDLGHGAGPGTTTVDVRRAGEMVLVLSSYEPVHWVVTASTATDLLEVVLNGYHAQSASVPSGVKVTERSIATTGSWWHCGYQWPASTGGCDERRLVAEAERYSGLALSSFQGCYHGTAWVLE
jgi:hypothetical protein